MHYNNLIGKPVFTIPYLGYLSAYVKDPPGRYIALAAAAVLLLLVFLPDLFDGEKKKERNPAPVAGRSPLPQGIIKMWVTLKSAQIYSIKTYFTGGNEMKSKKKVFMTVLCAAALVVASVLGTMAFLTSKDKVNNTFTVGNVAITLDEAKVTDAGNPVEGADRVKANIYKLIPGHEYTKDPTVHVTANSEDSWVFIKVEDGLAAIEDDTTVADQITGNGWTALDGVAGVYYKEYSSSTAATDLVVFETFKVKGDADVAQYANAKIDVTAYAIQKDGFTTPAAAWAEVSK